MGVLDDAIREHLELKRRHGASDEEISRAEAEALTPARRPAPAEEAPARLTVEPVDDVAPPPAEPPAGTHAVHDIDEDPLAPPAPIERSSVDEATVETDAIDRRDGGDALRPPGRLSE